MRSAICLATFGAFAAPAPVLAEVDVPAAETCVTGAGTPAECVTAEVAHCTSIDAAKPNVASLCFRAAQGRWDDAIRAEMARLSAAAPEELAAIAGIEVKYDLIFGLTQCDRLEELARLAPTADPAVLLRQKSRCQALAAGMAYLRLVLRGASMKGPDP